jgi:8-oxo-dGTP diphosphatase
MIGGRVKAAGAVLWRPDGAGATEVALIHRPRYDDWSFPKGKADQDEHPVRTALREVEEETGFRCVLGRRLPNTEYEAEAGPKRVRYWAACPVGPSSFEPNEEVDAVHWLPPAEARRRLTSELDAVVLEAFLAAPALTFPIVLQRHGKAEHRGPDYPNDLARPLAAAGRAQAEALAGLLPAFGAEEAVSSPAVRCLGTIRPYIERAGLPLRTDAALSEIAYVHAPRAVVAWLRNLVAQRRGTVVCTHGPLLDELIAAVLYDRGFAGPAGLDEGPTLAGHAWDSRTADRWANDSLPKGCAYVLHFDATAATADGAGPRLLAADRLWL